MKTAPRFPMQMFREATALAKKEKRIVYIYFSGLVWVQTPHQPSRFRDHYRIKPDGSADKHRAPQSGIGVAAMEATKYKYEKI